MAGLIKREVIDEVRDRVRIDDVVREYVTLKPAGVGSLKGLCPFHDEKTPSFNVRPHIGRWHCFGCGEGGDAIAFIERIEHVSFVEAVEILANKAGVTIEYEAGKAAPRGPRDVTRSRLIDAHKVAREFYVAQLQTAAAEPARAMLAERGFDEQAIAQFQIGYSPDSWDSLLRELRNRGFTEKEIAASGLVTQGNRGMYDRFRGRVMWPIHSITGDPIGFGARKLSQDDQGPKYLNTPETMIYKKSQVLYGLDLAKRAIATERKVVVVEGYTDVMAAHLAGIPYAVATCGTAFGAEHVKIVRRLLGDSANPAAGVILSNGHAYGGEVIFTFDGDAAGQKAALRAFQEDQSFAAQTFVAVDSAGRDPCEVWIAGGNEAVKQLIANREPLFAFVIRSVLKGMPLHTPEGRTAGLRMAAPVVASIRDRVLRGEYSRQLSGWLGMDERLVRQAVNNAPPRPTMPAPINSGDSAAAPSPLPVLPDARSMRDPVARVERQALQVILQLPALAKAANAGQLPGQSFSLPIHAAVYDAIRAAGGVELYFSRVAQLQEHGVEGDLNAKATAWFVEQITEQADGVVRQAVTQLAVEPLPDADAKDKWPYVRGIMMSLIRQGITRQIADLRGEMQRAAPQDQEVLFKRLVELENQRRLFDETDT